MPQAQPLQEFFGRGGRLQRADAGAYEFRPGQMEMARAVAQALEDRHHLIAEAGTGTGKTLAYLAPVVLSGRRVLVSTGTKNLQEQLVQKDVPLLARALGRELRVLALKGRSNYACRQKIRELALQPTLLEAGELELYRSIREWEAVTEVGDQAELEFLPEHHPLWHRLNARRETCTGSQCPLFEQCCVTRVRQRAAEADVVVVNHHLFFADLPFKRQEMAGVLPPYEAVVFDEAHELEDVAGQYFGVGLSSLQCEELARDAGAVLRGADLTTPELEKRTEGFRLAAQRLFLQMEAREGRHMFEQRREWGEGHPEAYDGFLSALGLLDSGLEAIEERPEEVRGLQRRLQDAGQKLEYLLESRESGIVYWLERRGRGVYLQATPIQVAGLLRDLLFEVTDTVILTSATLAVGGSFEFVRQRLGLDHARECLVASPFDHRRQALLYIPAELPEPNHAGFVERAAREVAAILEASRGRAFLLCTSAANMRQFHQELLGEVPYPLLVQGSMPRPALLDRFRSTPGAVLIATSSFWQGVDVQGEQLSCVIVDRLPFAAPADPIVQARIRAMQEEGRKPFFEYQVPEAVLTLKQGFGRLLRAASDRGVLALLDRRVVTKPYGRLFLESLPDYERTSNLEDVRNFFSEAAVR